MDAIDRACAEHSSHCHTVSLFRDSLKIEKKNKTKQKKKKVPELSQKCVPMCHVLLAATNAIRVEQVDTAVMRQSPVPELCASFEH